MGEETLIYKINIDLIIPNRFQPRLTFDEKALNELAASIKEHGIIQPLVLRKLGDKYEIIAGERRYKAASIAGLSEVPAIISDLDDNQSAEIALVENVQRKNLNSLEEAKSYKKILDKGALTQDQLAKKIGISQSAIANKLRLLNLSPVVQEALMNEKISERHARSFLQLTDFNMQDEMLKKVIKDRLTVRQLDLEITNIITPKSNIKENNLDVDIETIKNNSEDISPINIKQSFSDIFSAPRYPSLDDEVTNLAVENIDSLFDDNENLSKPDVDSNDLDLSIHSSKSLDIPDEPKEIEKKYETLDDIITAYHELKDKISNSKFEIKVEEYDFTDLYQIIIKIDKQN